MDILTMLTTQGSQFTAAPNGTTPPINRGATGQSLLHADFISPGYSLNGADFGIVNAAYQAYNDGVNNFLPQPSQLDLDGATPPTYSQTGPVGGHY